MYEEKWQVRFSECDSNHKLTYDGIVNYFQDCSNLQSLNAGRGFDYLEAKNRAWILDFWQIVINERPKSFEHIKVSTWPNGFKGFFGTRNFVMKSENDHVLAYANSYWVYIDTATGRPVRVTPEEQADYPLEAPYEMEYANRKIDIPQDLEYVGEVLVKPHHIDIYNHVNNAQYIQIAFDYLPENAGVRQICCQYKAQARLNDVIKVYRKVDADKVTMVLKNEAGDVFAVTCFDIN